MIDMKRSACPNLQSLFSYRINRASDGERKFSITQHTGILTLSKELDREKTPEYKLWVEVVDSGELELEIDNIYFIKLFYSSDYFFICWLFFYFF